MDGGSEIRNIVQEAVIKTIPKKKKCNKAKWLSEEALQISEKRREGKGKGEKKRYIHLNAEFQRITRRDKIAFLSDQCKDRRKQQNGKDQRSLQDSQSTKETFHANMNKIKAEIVET